MKLPRVAKVLNIDFFDFKNMYFDQLIPPYTFINISKNTFFQTLLLNQFGVGNYEIKNFKKLLELTFNIQIDLFTPFQQYVFFYYYLYVLPPLLNYKDTILFNMWVLHYLYTYKGWRHFFDLPANGQRTWSNNKTRFRLINPLREYHLNCFKKKFGITSKTNLKISFLSEYLNIFWICEWNDEWLTANETFQKTKSKTTFFRLRVNYRHLMNKQISTPHTIELKKKKKNRKKLKSEFTVGFEPLYVVSLFSKKKYLFKHLF